MRFLAIVRSCCKAKQPYGKLGVQSIEDPGSKLFLAVQGKTIVEDQSPARLMKQTFTYRPSSAPFCNGGYANANGSF